MLSNAPLQELFLKRKGNESPFKDAICRNGKSFKKDWDLFAIWAQLQSTWKAEHSLLEVFLRCQIWQELNLKMISQPVT